jgi:hypothetical protein
MDQPVSPWEFDDIATALTGRPAKDFSSEDMEGNLGRVRMHQIDLNSDLWPFQRPRVYAHELGHVIDRLSGEIRQKGLEDELRRVYHELNSPSKYDPANPFTPQHRGYSDAWAPREYMAEAVRAYLTRPNYLKTVAPETAAAIRAAVNANRQLNRIIQFNSALMPVGAADLLGSPEEESDEGTPENGSGGGRLNLRDLPPSDGLPIEEWIKRRNQQTNKLRR